MLYLMGGLERYSGNKPKQLLHRTTQSKVPKKENIEGYSGNERRRILHGTAHKVNVPKVFPGTAVNPRESPTPVVQHPPRNGAGARAGDVKT